MSRIIYDMDREWSFRRAGELKQLPGANKMTAYEACKAGNAAGPASVAVLEDGSAWRVVDLPHDYLSEAPLSEDENYAYGYRKREDAWYRKTFTLEPALKGKQLFLCFEGTAVHAEFYFNGSLMERSFSAYTETTFEITDRASFDANIPNVLAVHINGHASEGWWYEGAGIYRHVRLYAKDSLHIAHNGLWANPVLNENTANEWTVKLETTLENTAYLPQDGVVSAELYDGADLISSATSAVISCPADEKLAVPVELPVTDPVRWDIDDPKLYMLRVFVEKDGERVDEDSVRIGFRTIAVDPEKGFLLNGRKVTIKGACNHQDHAGVGVAVPDSVQHYRVRLLKEMGMNGYRTSHNLPAKEILDACDELGMLVMDENRMFETRREVLEYLDIMVRRDRNHPSVVFWSLFNEEPLQNSKTGAAMYRRMKSRVKKLDDSRPVTGGINGTMEGAGMEMDITGINYAIDRIDDYHRKHPDQPIIGSENNSAVSVRGCYREDQKAHLIDCYDRKNIPWGQSIRQTWDFVRKHDYFAGIYIWTGFDYRGEPTPFVWPTNSSLFGIMDTCGFPKDSYYYNEACFKEEPVLHIMPHWNHTEGDVIRVATPTNCEETELFLNGRSLGRKRGDCIDTPEWEVEYAPGTLSAIGYRNGEAVVTTEIRTAGKPYAIRAVCNADRVKNDGQDTVLVNLSVVDENGTVVPDAFHRLRFTIGKGGFIRGAGNGDPNSMEPDHANERSAFHGWCQVLISAKSGATEDLEFLAEGEGLLPVRITIPVESVPAPLVIHSARNYQVFGFRMSEVQESPIDPLMEITDQDNNTFSPVVIGPNYPEGMRDGWRMFRTHIKVEKQEKYRLIFRNIRAAEAQVWLDGKRIYASDPGTPVENPDSGSSVCLVVPFASDAGNNAADLRILIRLAGSYGGIRNAVELIPEKEING